MLRIMKTGTAHSILSKGAPELRHDPVPLVSVDLAAAELRRLRLEVSVENAVTSQTTSMELQEVVLQEVAPVFPTPAS